MTVDTLFGPEEIAPTKPRSIKFKQIKAVFETLVVNEGVGDYLKPHIRYVTITDT